MQNKLLSLFSKTIPYIKELRLLGGSVTSAILIQQLDYWFARYPKGFYKFLSPPNGEEARKFYKTGQSWVEETGFSDDEFRTAFDKIGVAHKSKTAYLTAFRNGTVFIDSEGNEKYYARYHDREVGTSFYFRNHKKLDSDIFKLFSEVNSESEEQVLPELQKVDLPETDNVGLQEIGNVGLPYIGNTENTHTENTNTSFSPAKKQKKAKTESTALAKPAKKNVLTLEAQEIRTELWKIAERLGCGVIANSGKEAAAEKKLRNWILEGKITLPDIFSCVELLEKENHLAGQNSIDGYSNSLQSVVKYMPTYLRRKQNNGLDSSVRRFEDSEEKRERIHTERNYDQITENALAVKRNIEEHLKPRKRG